MQDLFVSVYLSASVCVCVSVCVFSACGCLSVCLYLSSVGVCVFVSGRVFVAAASAAFAPCAALQKG